MLDHTLHGHSGLCIGCLQLKEMASREEQMYKHVLEVSRNSQVMCAELNRMHSSLSAAEGYDACLHAQLQAMQRQLVRPITRCSAARLAAAFWERCSVVRLAILPCCSLSEPKTGADAQPPAGLMRLVQKGNDCGLNLSS